MENNRSVGRPKKTLADLPTNWELTLYELGSQGKFDMDAKVSLGISNDLFERFMNEEPKFSEAISKMRQLSETWWTSISIKAFQNGTSKNVNSNLYALMMRNAFKNNWNTTSNVDITSGGEKIDSTKKIEIEIVRNKIEKDDNIS
jgi:hypothetical protein